MPKQTLPDVLADAGAALAYIPNVAFAIEGTDYFAEDALVSLFQHYWSLGVEEQFYLFWPLVMLLGWRVAQRGSRWALLGWVTAMTGLSFALGFFLTRANETLAFFLLPSRGWELGAGAVLAVVLLKFPEFRLPRRVNTALIWAGLALIAATLLLVDSSMPWPGWRAAIPVIATALVVVGGSHGSANIVLGSRPLQFFGTISYSLYLVHWPLLVLPAQALLLTEPLPLWAGLLLALAGVPVAWLLWRFVEEPGRRATSWWGQRTWRPLAVAVTGFVLAVVLAFPLAAWVRGLPIDGGNPAPPFSVSTLPDGTTFVPSNMQPSLRESFDDRSHIFEDGCNVDQTESELRTCRYGENERAPLIVLFGDSHAAHWFPAFESLARDGAIRLELQTRNSCSTADERGTRNSSTELNCVTWREQSIARINEIKPDAVVIANFSQRRVLQFDDYAAALSKVIGQLDPSFKKFLISDTPEQSALPSVCLSQFVDNALACATPRDDALSARAATAERVAAQVSGSELVDINDRLCADRCPLIFGDTLAYRDTSHLTETFAAALAPLIHEAIAPAVAARSLDS